MFARILRIDPPVHIYTGKSFEIYMHTDGPVPFAQCILRQDDGWERIIKNNLVETIGENTTRFHVPAEAYHAGILYLQLEGCKTSRLDKALPEDWVKVFLEHHAEEAETTESNPEKGSLSPNINSKKNRVGLCIALHQHLGLPAGISARPSEWTEEEEGFFREHMRQIFCALERAVDLCFDSGHSNAGILFSWSGQLLECLKQSAAHGDRGGILAAWNLLISRFSSSSHSSRLPFCRSGWSDDLLLFQPEATVRSQLDAQEEAMNESFAHWSTEIIYPPSLGFSPHLIPHFSAVGATVVLFDILHHYRACLDYPGHDHLPPPNRADQENYRRHDWVENGGISGTSFISPGLLRPSILLYTDSEGHRSEMIGLPLESTLSEMLIKGDGESLYRILETILDQREAEAVLEPERPALVLLSAGDNPRALVERVEVLLSVLEKDLRLSLITPQSYLDIYSVDSSNLIHLGAGVARGQEGLIPLYRHDLVGRPNSAEENSTPDLIQTAMGLPFHSFPERLISEFQKKVLLRELLSAGVLSCQRYPFGRSPYPASILQKYSFPRKEGAASGEAPVVLLPWYQELDDCQCCIRVFAYASAGISNVTLYYHEVGGGYESLSMQEEQTRVETGEQRTASLFQLICPSEWANIRYFIEVRDRLEKNIRTPLCRLSFSHEL